MASYEKHDVVKDLRTFLNAAGAEGFVLDGVDGGSLYMSIFSFEDKVDHRFALAAMTVSDAQSVRDAWISVDERLPEPGAAVLIAFADGGVDLSFRYVMKKTGEHVCWEGVEFENHESPTHWQPLPAPPQKPVSDEVKP